MTMSTKSHRDKYLEDLKNLAKSIEVSDVEFNVGDRNRPKQEVVPRREDVIVTNKYDLAENVIQKFPKKFFRYPKSQMMK